MATGPLAERPLTGVRQVPAPRGAPRALPATLAIMRPGAGPFEEGVVLLTPGRADLARAGWLEASAHAAGRAASEPLLYVVPPRGWRGRTADRLRRAGWQVGPPTAHLVARGMERALVPLDGRTLALAIDVLPVFPAPRRGARLLAQSASLRAGVAEVWPRVGMAAWPMGGLPPYDWLADTGDLPPAGVVSLPGWREQDDTVVVVFTDPLGGDRRVARVMTGNKAPDAEALVRLGASARAAGARVPELIHCRKLGERTATVMTWVAGEAAWRRLRSKQSRLAPLLEQLTAWLAAWHHDTACRAPFSAADMERDLLAPARALAAEGGIPKAYPNWLAERGARVLGTPFPWVAAHNDTTMHNVRLADGGFGIIDWESATARSWPLADFEYCAVDAAAAVHGYRDRVAAWQACFDGDLAGLLAPLRARIADSIELSAELAELCRHACWLHHAGNESRLAAGADRPFLEIARRIAATATVDLLG
ncbi:MAG TPA: hypothetical protein VK912_19360 [Longimicrobiales bacterium]|nr:hypothetical protein [Longimicrobiales bacterium]